MWLCVYVCVHRMRLVLLWYGWSFAVCLSPFRFGLISSSWCTDTDCVGLTKKGLTRYVYKRFCSHKIVLIVFLSVSLSRRLKPRNTHIFIHKISTHMRTQRKSFVTHILDRSELLALSVLFRRIFFLVSFSFCCCWIYRHSDTETVWSFLLFSFFSTLCNNFVIVTHS